MPTEPDQPLVCNLGVTGKTIREALAAVQCRPEFRETLRRQLIEVPHAGIEPPAGPSRRTSPSPTGC